MAAVPRRGLAWFSARLQFIGFKLIGWGFSVFVTFVVISAVMPAIRLALAWLQINELDWTPYYSLISDFLHTWFIDTGTPWNNAYYVYMGEPYYVTYIGHAIQAVQLGPFGPRLIISVVAYFVFTVLRFLYLSARYGFARELLLMRVLTVVDPQMALIRQRLVLEQAISELTEPMREDHGVNLYNGIQALTMLGKLPERETQLAHTVRIMGNTAAHPRHEDQRLLMRPGNAVAISLATKRNLKRFLAWYRRNHRRNAMTRDEWRRISHNFEYEVSPGTENFESNKPIRDNEDK